MKYIRNLLIGQVPIAMADMLRQKAIDAAEKNGSRISIVNEKTAVGELCHIRINSEAVFPLIPKGKAHYLAVKDVYEAALYADRLRSDGRIEVFGPRIICPEEGDIYRQFPLKPVYDYLEALGVEIVFLPQK